MYDILDHLNDARDALCLAGHLRLHETGEDSTSHIDAALRAVEAAIKEEESADHTPEPTSYLHSGDLKALIEAASNMTHGLPDLLDKLGYTDEEGMVAACKAALAPFRKD